MKNRMGAVIAVLALILLSPMWALAGNGKGVMDGTGPAPKHDLLQGIPFEYTGTVVECNDGQGLVLYVGDEGGEEFSVVISGIGPQRYWDLKAMERPCVGDKIAVTGYTINYNELELNIAFTITFEGESSIELRDPATGLPLWRMAGLKKNIKRCEE